MSHHSSDGNLSLWSTLRSWIEVTTTVIMTPRTCFSSGWPEVTCTWISGVINHLLWTNYCNCTMLLLSSCTICVVFLLVRREGLNAWHDFENSLSTFYLHNIQILSISLVVFSRQTSGLVPDSDEPCWSPVTVWYHWARTLKDVECAGDHKWSSW